MSSFTHQPAPGQNPRTEEDRSAPGSSSSLLTASLQPPGGIFLFFALPHVSVSYLRCGIACASAASPPGNELEWRQGVMGHDPLHFSSLLRPRGGMSLTMAVRIAEGHTILRFQWETSIRRR